MSNAWKTPNQRSYKRNAAIPIINGTFKWYILLTSDTVAIYTE
jgi:hypothetical protein